MKSLRPSFPKWMALCFMCVSHCCFTSNSPTDTESVSYPAVLSFHWETCLCWGFLLREVVCVACNHFVVVWGRIPWSGPVYQLSHLRLEICSVDVLIISTWYIFLGFHPVSWFKWPTTQWDLCLFKSLSNQMPFVLSSMSLLLLLLTSSHKGK